MIHMIQIAYIFVSIYLFTYLSFHLSLSYSQCRNKAFCDPISGACTCQPGWNGPL